MAENRVLTMENNVLMPGETRGIPAAAPTLVGHNTLNINTATMKQVMQFWLAHKWAGATPTVDDVSWDSAAQWFRVKLTDAPDA